jgi:hypothetical protein
MAHVVQNLQRPALILAPNETLAAQLYGEMKSFFPDNAVEYFVSYYDYYQPEACSIGKTNAIRPCLSNVDAEAGSAAARAKAPESRSWRVVPGVFGLAGASVAAPSDPIRIDRGRRSPCVSTAGRGRGASGVGEAVMRRYDADRVRPGAPARSGPLRRGCGR